MTVSLKEMLKKFIDEYASELAAARASEDYKRPFGNLVRKDISSVIQANVDDKIYKVKGSVGAGRWTDVPWIAVFDKRITTSAQRGVYIVYLLNKDTKELFLTLNQGATNVAQGGGAGADGKLAFTGIASTNNKKTTEMLISNAQQIRDSIADACHLQYGTINTGSGAYDAGCIYYKKYELDKIPTDDELYEDLNGFIEAYGLYYERMFNPSGLNEKGDETEVTHNVKDLLNQIEEYIAAKGFAYSKGLIENFYLSLRSKPFVILAGTSGTGKTRLVKLFAEAINAHYKMVPVRPDWSDSSDLFGHVDLNGKFVPGAIIDFIAEASAPENSGRPYILCLDEMNLARVEYYMSDFLSVIETRDFVGDDIVSDPLVTIDKYGPDEDAIKQYGELRFPQNLYLVGTVNMDETTFPFSKKVLDRANTIEFNYVDLIPDFSQVDGDVKAIDVDNESLRTKYLTLANDCLADKSFVEDICLELEEINGILKKANAHVGYRVRDEIVFYMLNNHKADDLITYEEAMDNEILQKILPRIQGSSAAIKDLLVELFKFCMHDSSALDTESGNVGKDMQGLATSAKYPGSAMKISYMMKRYEEDGFTSYWL